ncbi:MAG TPA: glycosyltransferase [Trebonia sp.]|nr:glycosyltransferase [Trebonia sp.]
MRIALVAARHGRPVCDDGTGEAGEDIQLRELSRRLADEGHEVAVYAPAPEGGPPSAQPGVRVEYIETASRPSAAGISSDILSEVPAFSGPLRERWSKDRPDVVHAMHWTSGLAALAAARDLQLPVVQSFQSLGVAERRHRVIPQAADAERIRLEPAIGRTAMAVLAGSAEVQSDLTRLGVPRRCIKVVPCGVDTTAFTPEGPAADRGDRSRLVTVTGLREHDLAALTTVLRALAKVPGTELVIAGGPERGELGSHPVRRRLGMLADSLGLADQIEFTGQLGRSALPPLLRSADLFVTASEYDPSGMTSVQAMACGLPVVASAVGGQLDAVVEGTTGMLVPPGNPAVLANKLRLLLSHPMLRDAFSVAAADRAVHRYSWDRIAAETLAAYDSAVGALPAAA